MNRFTKWLRASKGASAPPRDPVVAEWFGGGNVSMTGASVTAASAMQAGAVFACVRVLAETVAQLPLNVYARDANGGRSRAHAHPLFPILHLQPNNGQTSFEWREMIVGHMALRGVSYSQIFFDNSGRVVSLVPLHPDRTRPFKAPDGGVAFDTVAAGGQRRTLLPAEVLYLPGMCDDLYRPLSPIGLHRETIGFALGAREYQSRFYSGSAQPKGAIKMPGVLGEEATKMLRDSWERRHQGLENSNKVAILDGGMDWVNVGMTNEDAQFLQSLGANNEDVARIFRVPPHKIGILDKATFSNIEQQSLEFLTDTLLPWLVRCEQRMNLALLTPSERKQYYVAFDVKGMLRGDFKARTDGYKAMFGMGSMSPNDIRELEDMNPIDGGEKYYIPLNVADTETHAANLSRDRRKPAPPGAEPSEGETENE